MTIRQKLNTEKAAGIVCTMPFIVGFLAFMIIPMCISLYYSFCDYNILQPPTFTGWANFKRMFSDATFYQSLVVTFKFAIISVPLRLIFGLVNKLLMVFGMKEPVAWLGDTRTAIWTLIILAVWQFGSSMLIFLSALKQIPVSLYEAARVDGANGWQQFWKITLKLLTPTIHFNLVMQMINGFLAFTQCLIITQGKPMNSTLFYTVYMYQQSFLFGSTGYGAALAWIMLALIAFITWILFATKKLWVYDGGL